MSLHPKTDLGNQVKSAMACASATLTASDIPSLITAGGVGDGLKVTGQSVDRQSYESCVLAITGLAQLAEDKTISIAAEYQESSDESTWDTAVALQASTVAATGGTGGSEETFAVELSLKLKPLKQYVRFNVTATMSATATDIALFSAVCVLAGADVLPAA